ncbi:MAG: twin-arginine translocase TatA/TatE family subunit [Gammaproteobacteria bacterium]|nr:twin-arginine translocase TatA/TatE family subunit [Gammaproteobacteria bacterium]
MGLGGVSFWQLLIVFGIVILIFGTSRLKSIGGDLGGAIKGFRKAMETDDDKSSDKTKDENKQLESGQKPDAEFSEQAEKEKHS